MRRRQDGDHVEGLAPMRTVVPFLMPRRSESTVYYPHRVQVEELMAWLAEQNAARPAAERISIFHVFLAALGRTLRLRPEVNRFVLGRRTYQHREISVSFVVKTAMNDEAPESLVRLVLTGHESVEEVRRAAATVVGRQRAGDPDDDDRLVDFFASWPRPLLRTVVSGVRWLDDHNRLPSPLRRAIPLYASVFVVNTGSLGIDAPYHHLYEMGTASVFIALGRVAPQPVVDDDGEVVARQCLDLVYTLDERSSDGFYFARTVEVFTRLLTTPGLLAQPDLTVGEILAEDGPQRG